MLDSLRKRCEFVRGAVAGMGITDAETLWGRAEALGQDAATWRRDMHQML